MFPFLKSKPAAEEKEPLAKYFNDKEENKLQSSIEIAINALEKDIFPYDWTLNNSCNCGIMVQSIMGIDRDSCNWLFTRSKQDIGVIDMKKSFTWKNITQLSCTVTGMPIKAVFILLNKKGLRPEDMVHLEYLSNSAILEVSGIDTSDKYYYRVKGNLILYLKAWLKIMSGSYDENELSEKALIEAKLIIAQCV